MSLFDKRSKLTELTFAAIKSVVDRLNREYKNKVVYSLVIYPASGYVRLGISYSTRSFLEKKRLNSRAPVLEPDVLEMLKDHPDLLRLVLTRNDSKLYLEVNACEWVGAGSNADLFSEVNDVIDAEYDALYDDGVDNTEICRFFEELLTEVLSEVS